MSISRSTEASSPGSESPYVSLEERAAVNLSLIQQLILQQPPQQVGQADSLQRQIMRLANSGFSLQTIATALVVSNIAMKTLLIENRIFSEEELNKILTCCQDLSEASGSSSGTQPPMPIPTAPPILEETPTLSEPTTSKPLELHLPLKKRKKTQESLLEQQPGRPTQSPDPQAISFLLDTALLIRESPLSATIRCPEGSGKDHQCLLCFLTQQIVKEKKYILLSQLSELLNFIDKTALIQTLCVLVENNSLTPLKNLKSFTRLDFALIIAHNKLGNEVCLPKKAHPSTSLNIFLGVKRVVSKGLIFPLTQQIQHLWDSSPKVKAIALSTLILNEDGSLNIFSVENFSRAISVLERRYYHEGRPSVIHRMSATHTSFLAQVLFATLEALKASEEGLSLFSKTKFGWPAIRFHIVEHIYSLLLATNPFWRLEITPNKIWDAPSEDLRFPAEERSLLFSSLQNFISRNGIIQAGCGYIMHRKQSSISLEPREPIAPTEEPPRKKSRVKLISEQTEEQKPPKLVEMETPTLLSSSNPEDIESIKFLLSEIARTQKATLSIRCPKETEEPQEMEHVCSLCLLAKQFLWCSSTVVKAQLSILLSQTTLEKLSAAILQLPSSRNFSAIVRQKKFDNISVAFLIRSCEIGDSICLPRRQNPSSQVDLYLTIEKIVKTELKHPTTKAIISLWDLYTLRPEQQTSSLSSILTIKNNQTSTVTLDSLLPLLSSIEQLYTYTNPDRRCRVNIKRNHAETLCKITLHTLQALLLSPDTQKFVVTTESGPAIPHDIVEHIYCLILSSQPTWSVVILPTRASIELESLRLPEEQAKKVHAAMRKFCKLHRISLSKGFKS
ncbi:hypothetical protein [Chlamydiifrater phoenicopteri]|uniref:hypothetical protein n=1 Tax=Chlamydiifrater phoenicopteri TaxID=2681469 RepID=UPI001BCA78C2|nr:hypothetical protein [Chlamydiifrater phoenicopteri]